MAEEVNHIVVYSWSAKLLYASWSPLLDFLYSRSETLVTKQWTIAANLPADGVAILMLFILQIVY